MGLRVNPLKTDAVPDLGAFGLEPVPWESRGYYYNPATRPGLSPYHEAGLYYLQEPSAMAPAGLLDVRPGMRVLDLCAAPGGKSTQLAAALQGQGLLIANEIHPQRARILARNFERLAVANGLVLNEHPQRLAERFPRYFDRILVDAPCSGEGMFRKEEAALTDWSEETVAMCAGRQYEILCSAAAMLAPGGRLVYSTCTFAPAENEGVVSRFFAFPPGFRRGSSGCPLVRPRAARLGGGPGSGPGVHLPPLAPPAAGRGPLCRRAGTAARRHGRTRSRRGPLSPAEAGGGLRPGVGTGAARRRLPLLRRYGLSRPRRVPALRGLKVLRAGLELGQLKKNRFEPAHAWALWLKSAASVVDLAPDSREAAAYLRGETVPGSAKGWTLVTTGGLSLGWAKGDGATLKNHFPKPCAIFPKGRKYARIDRNDRQHAAKGAAMGKTVLIVEDEKAIVEILKFNLQREGYTVLEALDGETGLGLAKDQDPDLILLDVMLPKMNGFDVCRALREAGFAMPILMLTAREEENDKVFGLESGADDYITKPFSMRELLARVKANIRRRSLDTAPPAASASPVLRIQDVTVDPATMAVTKAGKAVDVTQKEYDLLLRLFTEPGKVCTREELLEKVWNYAYFGDTRTVDVAVRRLREKIEDDPGTPKIILTRRGVGYYCAE